MGDVVGYQIRLESCVSKGTCIRFVTDGILLRQTSPDQPLPAGLDRPCGLWAMSSCISQNLSRGCHERRLDAARVEPGLTGFSV